MPDLATRLRELRPTLTDCAVTRDPLGAVFPAPEISRFYDSLIEAVEVNSTEPLHRLAQVWVSEPLALNGYERPMLVPIVQALRQCTWETLAARLDPLEAVQAVIALEQFFAGMSLRLSTAHLETRLHEMETELEVARAELTRLDKSKSDFIAVAAHELKTPLTLIEGYSQLLGNEFPSDPRVEVLARGLANGTRRLKEIIEDMIDVSLIDNNLLALHYTPVDIGALLGEVRRETQDITSQRRLTLVLEVAECDLLTFADSARMRQVFAQILENAVKFTPDGGTINLQADCVPGFIKMTIADTGIGIAPQDQQRIFEKFGSVGDVSLHSSGKTKFKGGGPGLGLPIARGIVIAHGGRLWVESPGRDEATFPGTSVHILLPTRTQPPPEIKEPQLMAWAKNPKPWRQLGPGGFPQP
jgi:signal transduction histidine kinase